MSIIQQRESSYKDSNPDEIEIGNTSPNSASTSSKYQNSPFLNALDFEIDLWTNCVKEISKLVMNQRKISKDILNNTIELRKIHMIWSGGQKSQIDASLSFFSPRNSGSVLLLGRIFLAIVSR